MRRSTALPQITTLQSLVWQRLRGRAARDAKHAAPLRISGLTRNVCGMLTARHCCCLDWITAAERGHRVPEDVARLYFRDMCKVRGAVPCSTSSIAGGTAGRMLPPGWEYQAAMHAQPLCSG